MKLDLNLNLKQKQQLKLTPELKLAIKILNYSNLELNEYLAEKTKENPLLELLEKENEMNIKDNSFQSIQKEAPEYENMIAYQPQLCESLESQLFEILKPEELELGKFIVGSLNQKLELTLSPAEIADIFSDNKESLTEKSVQEIYQKIKELDFEKIDDSAQCQYLSPDLIVKEEKGEFKVESNQQSYPQLKISSYYYKLLQQEDDPETIEYLKNKYKSALWLIQSIEQRQQTIEKIARAIIKKQQQFFKKGLKYLQPMTMEAVAELIEMHESTVSRATTNKYLECKHGTFNLKFFFSSGLDGLSAVSIKAIICEEIAAENKKAPLSDQNLAELIQKQYEISISRRTIAKYRKNLKLPSSRERKEN